MPSGRHGDTALSQYQEVETSRRPCLDSANIRRNPFIFNGLQSRFDDADGRVLIEVQCPQALRGILRCHCILARVRRFVIRILLQAGDRHGRRVWRDLVNELLGIPRTAGSFRFVTPRPLCLLTCLAAV